MNLPEKLQIILITYNRATPLRRTLERLLAANSPLQQVDIHVLDNCSTDNTSQIVEQFARTHPNLHYTRHKYNVGLGGNLIKAMEMASKPYFWILCDDDDYDFTHWSEIATALESNQYDIVMTSYTPGFRSEQIPYLINEMCFVPSAIYKTAHIDGTVMTNAYAMAHNLFPFHALSIKIINNKGKIFVPQERFVLQSMGPKSHQSTKLRPGIYRRLQTFSLLWGYVDAYSLIEDKKLRYACMNVLCLGQNFLSAICTFRNWFPFTWQNMFDIFYYVSWKQKLQVLFALLISNPILAFYSTDRGLNIKLFGFIKTKIWPKRENA